MNEREKEGGRGKRTREGSEDGEDSRLEIRVGEKKNYDDPSSDSFAFLTTLKNRWTLSLIYLVVIVLIRTFPNCLSFRVISGRFSFVTTVVCRPNHRRKNVTPRTVLLLSICICICTHVYTYWQTLSIKNAFRVISLFFVSHVVVHRESRMKIGKRQRERVCQREREEESQK